MASSIITDYIGCGLAAARPATPNLASGSFGIYYATDTGAVSIWNGSSWSGLSGSGTLTGLTGDVAASGSGSVAATLQVALTPGGRLTLASNTPVMNADATAQGTVYYAPYVHARVPIYSGSVWAMKAFAQLTLTLNSTDNTSTNLYDIFVVNIAGTLTLGTAPAWTNSTTRSNAIALLDGVWTNNASIALRANGSALSGSPFAANTATYLGTTYCTGNGQTGMAFMPAAAGGGTNNILGLYNAYNRVPVSAMSRDSTASWTVSNTSWSALNTGATGSGLNNRVSFVDGLQQSVIKGTQTQFCNQPTQGKNSRIGMSLDSSTATPQVTGRNNNVTANAQSFLTVPDRWGPQLGFHYIQAQQFSDDATNNTGFTSINNLLVELMM